MGRAIVYKESLYPEKRSRLFLSDEVLDVLLNNKGTEAIQTMTVDVQTNVPLSTKVFSKMTRLRVLIILSMNVSGSLKYLSDELRLLYWRNCSLRRMPTDCRLKKLVILEMIESSIVEFQPKLQNFICLEVLCLEHCEELKRAPNFSGAHSLKKLVMWNCSNLVKISKSIGDLKNLVELDVGFCKNLRELPSSICKLKSLKVLMMEGCPKIKELPKKLGELEQLCELIAGGTSVSHLPLSCGSLRYLRYMVLGPKANLTYSEEMFQSFSSSDDNLCPLRTLIAPYHYVQHPGLEIDSFSLLSILDLSGSNFNALPFNLCHLSVLEDLYLNNCQNLRVLPDLPPCLLFLKARNCPLLEKLPNLSDLKLKELDLSYCSNLTELQGLGNLKSINSIYIRNCSALNINSWFVNCFKAHSRGPKLSILVSKDMVREYLCSHKVFGSSPHNTLQPVYLEEKLRLFMWSPSWCTVGYVLKYKTTGVELLSGSWRGDYEAADDLMQLSLSEYGYFTEPIKVEELEVSISMVLCLME
ncbi:PREDICTED: disease resistance protein TAO1-like [Ipomoea nil]|uniref:disease resistance protein TAO1-like n=1 Tax=Ipomoea nil TaxID=35883 RepID=UPI0009008B55|nr:PREDICTED: disease resistance protein TAO1-like [Ipomoea nil]